MITDFKTFEFSFFKSKEDKKITINNREYKIGDYILVKQYQFSKSFWLDPGNQVAKPTYYNAKIIDFTSDEKYPINVKNENGDIIKIQTSNVIRPLEQNEITKIK